MPWIEEAHLNIKDNNKHLRDIARSYVCMWLANSNLWGKIVTESNEETDNETMKNTACIQRPTNKEIKTHNLLKV